VPRYIALGVTTLKIQGREYPTPLIAELTKIYRRLIDQTRAGLADVTGARARLDPVLAERDHYRNAKTSQLHERLMAKMSEELHLRLVARMEASDWDPDSEEARLRRAEPTA
jgi:collagenase-like PrtC family protease